ncbi:MAG TPA: isopentenyl phosphate kinase [Thermoplasmata archaeon]|nr:isopentenyl phosphate kinase [Thermoplasmata archaeon]
MAEIPRPERSPVIVKLGGSVITRKREVERLRPKVIARLATEIAAAPEVPRVVLHGAGSFGHPGARRFHLAEPPGAKADTAERARGAALVMAEVRRLHLHVLRELGRAGAAPASVPVATHARNREGLLVSLDAGPFEDALERGLLPVSFGDVVPDDAWGSSILSADTIAVALVPVLHPSRVIFVSDVPGVLRRPVRTRPDVFADVTPGLLEELRPAAHTPDVTGGIRGKVSAMLSIARAGVDAGLISGLTDGALSRAIRGERVYGSWARAGTA